MITLSKLTMVGVALMAATSLFAETDNATTLDFSTDSLYSHQEDDAVKSYHFGKREVIFDDNGIHFIKDRYNFDSSFDDDDSKNSSQTTNYQNTTSSSSVTTTNYSSPNPKKYRYFSSNLASIELGVARFASKPLSVDISDSVSHLDLNRGVQVGLCFDAAGVPIISRRLGIGVGVGMKCDIYSFSTKNLALVKDNGRLIHYADTSKPYNKSKLTNTYLTVPVVLEFHSKGLWVMAGVEGNLLVWSNTKMKTSAGDKERVHTDLCQNLFSYNLMAKVGVDCIGAFVRANMSPMFAKNKGPEIYPYSAGVSLTF